MIRYLAENLGWEERLLALFKLWNIVEYFYPYKHLARVEWGLVLREFIPRVCDPDMALIGSVTFYL